MSARERLRLDAFKRVKRQELSVVEAARLLNLSVRQGRRLWQRFCRQGDAGLVHGLRGRVSNHRMPEESRDKIVQLHQARYHDFGPTLACEKLAEEGWSVTPNTLTAILKERQLWQRRRKAGRHRQRRERKKFFGQMLQQDGSPHDWFETGKPSPTWPTLMVIVDDATGITYARLYRAETTEAAMDVFNRWIALHGVPRSLYVDRHSIYQASETLAGVREPTQFGRAMQELQVELIPANSPQAKGRVERKHQVFQDRLVKELRLRGITDMDQANVLLETVMLPEFNRRYAVKPARSNDLHRKAPADIAEILCVREKRVVGNDWCVRWNNRWLQIAAGAGSAGLAGKVVSVSELSTGKLLVKHGRQVLSFQEIVSRPKPEKPAGMRVPRINNRRWKPAAKHPWKTGITVGKALPPPAKNFSGVGVGAPLHSGSLRSPSLRGAPTPTPVVPGHASGGQVLVGTAAPRRRGVVMKR